MNTFKKLIAGAIFGIGEVLLCLLQIIMFLWIGFCCIFKVVLVIPDKLYDWACKYRRENEH